MKENWQDAAATAAAFTTHGFLRTGDVGSTDAAGYLRLIARRSELIVCGGVPISPAEVETVITDHPHVAEVAVVAEPDARLGQVPRVVIVLRERGATPAEELAAWCEERTGALGVPLAVGTRAAAEEPAGQGPAACGARAGGRGPCLRRSRPRDGEVIEQRAVHGPGRVRVRLLGRQMSGIRRTSAFALWAPPAEAARTVVAAADAIVEALR